MIIGCKLATTEYGAETFFQSQLVTIKSLALDAVIHYSIQFGIWLVLVEGQRQ